MEVEEDVKDEVEESSELIQDYYEDIDYNKQNHKRKSSN